jgi:pimeloyl-ACP methyl ester carboxylesterase
MATIKTPNDFLVEGLEEVEPAYKEFAGSMYAGLLPSNNHGRVGEMMFWLFEPKEQLVPDSIVIWLNGGPGCSSFNCGVLMEHSPVTQPLHAAGYCCLQPSPKLSVNEHAWTRATTVLYIEQPIGTGFSYGYPFPENEHDVSKDIYAFLQNFFKVFDHMKAYSFYVMGESYAGMFVPSIARHIHLENLKAEENGALIIQLKGAAIGNGWIDAKVQGPAVIDYSWWHGLIDEPTRDALHNAWKNCVDSGKPLSPPFHPFNVQDDCGMMWGVLQAAGQPNAYDVTTWDPNVDQITFSSEVFYNSPAVKKALHAPMNITWHGCRDGGGRRLTEIKNHRRLYMDNDRPLSVAPYIADLLDADIPVLVYNGDRDMTTNMVGSERVLNQMEWSGKKDWLDAKRGLWMVDSKVQAGWAKELGNLAFVVVYNSGHMVPYNQPVPAFDLLTRFLQKKSFLDLEMPTIRVERASGNDFTDSYMTNIDSTMMSSSVGVVGAGRGWETMGSVGAVSFLAGVACCWFLVGRPAQRRGYQQVA